MIPEHLPTLDLDETWAEAEQESWQPWWAPVLGCLALMGYLVASELDYRGAVQREQFAVPACDSCLIAEPVRYGEGSSVVFVDWVNPGEEWE